MLHLLGRCVAAAGAVAALALSGPGPAAAQDTVTLAVQPSTDVPQLLMAIQGDMWTEAGLDVNVVTFTSGREALEALIGGQADFAVLTEYPATIGILRNQPFKILADMARYSGSRLIASKEKTALGSVAELAGRRIGTTIGTNVEFVTTMLLAEAGIEAEIVNAAPADIVPAIVRGDVDAAVPFPSVYAVAERLLGENYEELRTDAYTAHGLLVGTDDVIKSNPEAVKTFLSVLLKADAMLDAEPQAGKDAIITALQGAMTAEVMDGLWVDYDYGVGLAPDLLDLMSLEAKWIAGKGMVQVSEEATEPAQLRAAIADGFLKELAPDAVTLD